MPNSTTDYDALAKKYGGTSDVDAIAKKYGGTAEDLTQQAEPSMADRFSMETARGMGLNPEKMRAAYSKGSHWYQPGGMMGQGIEAAGEIGTGMGRWAKNVMRDPFHIVDPIDDLASSIVTSAGLPDKGSIMDPNGYSWPNPGKLLGSIALTMGGAEKPARSARMVDPAAKMPTPALPEKPAATTNPVVVRMGGPSPLMKRPEVPTNSPRSLILTPDEALAEAQRMRIAAQRAKDRGLQFAGGMTPREGRKVARE